MYIVKTDMFGSSHIKNDFIKRLRDSFYKIIGNDQCKSYDIQKRLVWN